MSPAPGAPKRTSTPVLLVRGLTLACPRCGGRHLFRRWFSMRADCPRCGLHFEREEGFFLGAYMINLALAMGALLVVFIAGFALTAPDTPAGKLAAFAGAVGVLVPLVCYPFSKTIWCAIDTIMRHGLGEQFSGDGSQPGIDR